MDNKIKKITLITLCFLYGCFEKDSPAITSSLISPTTAVPIGNAATTWQWQLSPNTSDAINTTYGVDVYDLDLFDTSDAVIAEIHNNGSKVVCYFSGGSSENWRDDFNEFDEADLGSNLDGWDEERWLDIRSQNVLKVIKARIDYAAEKDCDGVEPDNMDGYQNDEQFNLTANDQLEYNRTIANYARSKGLSVGLKNDTEQIQELVEYFDFAVTEQCFEMDECTSYSSFIDAEKPVFNAEYSTTYYNESAYTLTATGEDICDQSVNTLKFRTLIMPLELDDSFRISCD